MSTSSFPLHLVKPHQDRLNAHPVYGALKTMDDLRVFMEHHVYSVWDFMSLIKYLQGRLAPTTLPWAPLGDPMLRRFINELVLEEESDQGLPDTGKTPQFISHFELYTHAMADAGADPSPILHFVATAGTHGIGAALDLGIAPESSASFVRRTFDFIEGDRPHEVAAALALGREHIIPSMFRAFLADMELDQGAAPAFHYYLNRHIHLDEDFHAPMALRLVDHFIGDDAMRRQQAVGAAVAAIEARISFWDGVLERLPSRATVDA